MASGNGKAVGGMMVPPTESAKFHIGGQDINVPAINFYTLEQVRDDLLSLGPELHWIDYSKHILRIVAFCTDPVTPEETYKSLAASCSIPEMRELGPAMNELLRVSGFEMGEAEAAGAESPGIGTSAPSAPNSPPKESAPETSTGSSDHTRLPGI